MSGEKPTSLAEAAQLRLLLGRLGGAEAEARGADEESEREARMSARLDASLAELVAERRASRRRWFALSAAAALVLGLGGHYLSSRTGSEQIAREPLAPGAASTSPRAVESALPAALKVPTQLLPRVTNLPAPPGPSASGSGSATLPPSALPSASAGSTLGEENQLFKDAAEATRRGDVGAALSGLDKLLTEHPGSPLAQTALVRKFRLLASFGKADEARREATRYLASYPTGFAVAEAQALKDGGPP